ncbi:MAG: trypsin-like peptidase domain-containing protein [Erysipelotrichaceae bacterium]
MKKKLILYILVGLLVAWNLFLTGKIYFTNNKVQTNIVNQEVSNITTDLSKVYDTTKEKIVFITTLKGERTVSTGSGIVYNNSDKKLIIVTNNHVIASGDNYKVGFLNGETLEAKLIGKDELTDLAALEVSADYEVKPLVMADSSLTKVGEYVLAIGSPLGLAFQTSTTFGIISGTNRLIGTDLNGDGIEDWDNIVLQTDAAINPGNSGGALINLAGELVGITTLKIANQNVEGMGFAIPSNEVVSIVEQLKSKGSVERPQFGVSGISLADITNYEKNYYGIDLKKNKGIYVTKVISGSAAESAGIQPKDIIVEFDGQEVTNYKSFRLLLYKHQVGDQIAIKVDRNNELVSINVKLR